VRTLTYKKICLLIFFAVLVWSGINPHDYFTWFLEVAPALGGLAILVLVQKRYRFEFTKFLYPLFTLHAIVLMIGAHWTYAEVPFFNWLRDAGVFSRNNYDKVGHFMQGFVPVLMTREVLLRISPLKKGGWVNFLSVCVVLAASAFYELIEWWISIAAGSAGDSFLGTQGYTWDTQADMLFCLIGSIIALILFQRTQDRGLSTLQASYTGNGKGP
jgi:putative membrane protein